MSGQAWPTQTESWPSGTGLTRCVCLYTCVCACVDWKPARKQVEQRPQPASWAAARGPSQQPHLEARLQGGPARCRPASPSQSRRDGRREARGSLPASAQGQPGQHPQGPRPLKGRAGLHTPNLTKRPGARAGSRSPQGSPVSW